MGGYVKTRKQYAPKGQKHIAQGSALGKQIQTMRPVRAKALIANAFAFTGRNGISRQKHTFRHIPHYTTSKMLCIRQQKNASYDVHVAV